MAKAKVLHLPHPRIFTAAEQVIEFISVRIMQSGLTYKQIAEDTGFSKSTIGNIASRKTKWPRGPTLFALLNYFKVKFRLE